MRARIVVLGLLIMLLVDTAIGIYLERELRGALEQRILAELTRHAQSAAVHVSTLPSAAGLAEIDARADAVAKATQTRVTIIDRTGRVLGDSQLDLTQLASVDNHATRPEVASARRGELGHARRVSDTVDMPMLYVALPASMTPWIVRASLPLEEVDGAVMKLRTALLFAGLVAMGMTIAALMLLSKLTSRTLRSVFSQAQTLAKDGGSSSVMPPQAEGQSLGQLARDLERTMSALATERNRFGTVLETMDQAVLAFDSNQQLTTINRAGRGVLRLDGDVEGRTLVEVVRLPALKELVERTGPGQSHTIELDIPGGRQVQAHVTGQSDGGTVIVLHDVTEIRRLERVRRDFVANVSHELRTPISVIRANTETLLAGAMRDPERGRQFLEAVLRHAERLGRLVSDLLDISRIEAGRYQLDLQPMNVADMAEGVVETLLGEAKSKSIRLTIEVDDDLEVMADPKALEHVLLNLVDNAIKYTPDGGHVELRARRAGDDICMEVHDDGAGIDPAHRQRIFERFYRVDPGRSRDRGGTGLGLSIVKHLVEAMQGRVGVEPRRPHGSVFWCRLPAPSAAASSAGDSDS